MAVVTMMAITNSGDGEGTLLEDSLTHQASNGDVVMITRDLIAFFLWRIEMTNITTTESYTP